MPAKILGEREELERGVAWYGAGAEVVAYAAYEGFALPLLGELEDRVGLVDGGPGDGVAFEQAERVSHGVLVLEHVDRL